MRLRPIATSGLVAVLAATGLVFTAGPAVAAPRVPIPAAVDVGLSFGGHRGGLTAVGLTGNGTELVTFSVKKPGRAGNGTPITGLKGDAKLVGIDHRVQNGKLYGVGDSGGLYVLSDKAVATEVGRLGVALSGAAFGVDFNPAANALRIVSDTGQNLRQPFGAGDGPTVATVADTPLTAAAAPAVGITAAAYTNNDLDPGTATTLFDLDTVADQVVLQSPANAGTLVPTGTLGLAADLDAGFDIYSTLRKNRTVEVTGYATIGVNGAYALYEVDPLTGAVEKKGDFRTAVTDLALPLGQR
ncbi:DUF4394 domain-containing protein [Nakamurella deserti]|uniref:DUF4394 domain-containing protein n=1 Tax=Nakamurella deserti TaxID=2164074 RepID=UPI000DBE5FBE|nr:DUF4394 domain-containing protein [Nakamurella deserti]